ncbi:acid phosphatase, partial [candidate division KSB1 bacterium]|nr:acid phosphatase [candidate division KSB1 bacterium]
METSKLRIQLLIILILIFVVAFQTAGQNYSESVVPKDAAALAKLDGHFTFMITSDLGRNGYYDQKPVAEMMGVVASISDPEFITILGDAHHFEGVASVHDPLWNTNFEWIYKHPELMMAWHPVMGNHEYEGNT